MKKLYFITGFIFAVCTGIGHSEEPADFSKISNFYGEWEVVKMEEFQGTLISDEEFKQAIKKPIIIKENYISCFGAEETDITFKYNKIINKFKEGEVGDRTTSVFYDFLPEREFIHQYQAWKNNERTGTLFEILSKDRILFMFAGRFVIVERKKPATLSGRIADMFHRIQQKLGLKR